jgi:glycosyltransferase involved in cell wall biosynthesis
MIKKIAVIDPCLNQGGGVRSLVILLLEIKKLRSDLRIDLFCDVKKLKNYGYNEMLLEKGIYPRSLKSFGLQGFFLRVIDFYNKTIKKQRSDFFPKGIKKDIEKCCEGYDLAYFFWPMHTMCPDLKCPMVATFHDFCFAYFYGVAETPVRQFPRDEMPNWMKSKVAPIVSTNFMAAEMKKLYPHAAEPKVINLASPNAHTNTASYETSLEHVKHLGISGPYFLYPGNLSAHKNIHNLACAIYLLNKTGKKITLLYTGLQSNHYTGKADKWGVNVTSTDPDVIGLGYIDDELLNNLMQCAEAIVSPSLYEAGCGPAFDAWPLGVPIAMSNIDPFVEHLDTMSGLYATLFDPLNPYDIAEKLMFVLENRDFVLQKAKESKTVFENYTWEKTTRSYVEFFENVCKLKSL